MPRPQKVIRCLTLLLLSSLLASCGFHLRQSADLPAAMQRVHLNVSGGAELRYQLRRQLLMAGAEVVDTSAPGVAELRVEARFRSRALTVGSYAQVREYTVQLQARMSALTGSGAVLLAPQDLSMEREFTYDRSQALGTATREEQVRASLVEDMSRAILRRLQGLRVDDADVMPAPSGSAA